MKNLLLGITFAILLAIFGRELLISKTMFDFHDVSQPARISEFTFDLWHMQIPPRIAPHMSYEMGYAVFNFYAPFSYWVSSFIHLVGFDIADSIKLSFLLALTSALIGMYFYLRSFFKLLPSAFGSILYTFSPYVAVEIFARGNLGEVWFLGLLPVTLLLFNKNSLLKSHALFFITALVTSFTLTAHNVLSLLFLPFVIVYILTLQNWKKNLFTLLWGVLIASYFLIPFLFESGFTNASTLAKITDYKDHFLCLSQLWTTPIWGFGASNPGCSSDGISFMLGKIQIIFGVMGVIIYGFLSFRYKDKKPNLSFMFIGVVMILSGFMTTYASQFIWSSMPFLAVFQFPWRLLIYTLFGLSFFSAYFFSHKKLELIQIVIPICILFILIAQSKYFSKPPLSKEKFNSLYLSNKVIKENIAYRVSEYLPTRGDYKYWRSIEGDHNKRSQLLNETKDFIFTKDRFEYSVARNDPFHKKAVTNSKYFVINTHYLPFWKIKINDKMYIPDQFDNLARPVIKLQSNKETTVELYFQQTPTETTANFLTIVGIIGLATLPLWDRSKMIVDSLNKKYDKS